MVASAFDTVIGHSPAVAALRRQVTGSSLSHALLIAGPDRVGKTTLALALATTLLDAKNWPGGIRAHPDLWLEDSDAERIGIAQVRNGGGGDDGPSLQDFLTLRPYAGGRRVAVVGRADRLTMDAANCLLKTIEEPPSESHIVLCSANPDGLPSTILSRCQTLTLAPVAAGVLQAWLEQEHEIEANLAATASALALGRPGRALRLAIEPGALGAEVDALDGFLRTAGGGVGGALQAASALAPPAGAEGRERALLQLGVWTAFLRDAVCVAEGVADLVLWTAYRNALEAWAQALPKERLIAMLGSTLAAVRDIAINAQPRLCYELLFLDLFAAIGDANVPPVTVVPERTAGMTAAPVGKLVSRASMAPRKSRARKR